MKMKYQLIICIATLFLLGCGSRRSDFVGNWRTHGQKNGATAASTLNISDDGSFNMTITIVVVGSEGFQENMKGTWLCKKGQLYLSVGQPTDKVKPLIFSGQLLSLPSA